MDQSRLPAEARAMIDEENLRRQQRLNDIINLQHEFYDRQICPAGYPRRRKWRAGFQKRALARQFKWGQIKWGQAPKWMTMPEIPASAFAEAKAVEALAQMMAGVRPGSVFPARARGAESISGIMAMRNTAGERFLLLLNRR
jgi:hypothetical protein